MEKKNPQWEDQAVNQRQKNWIIRLYMKKCCSSHTKRGLEGEDIKEKLSSSFFPKSPF